MMVAARHLSRSPLIAMAPAFEAIAGVVYIVWAGVYFVAFWSITGQTPGARIMQIRLVSAKRGRVKPARALVRWIGMNLAMLPLFAGFLPILWRRRGFPDWLAHTLVLDAPQVSLADARRAANRAARDGSRHPTPVVASETASSSSVTADGRAGELSLREPSGG
ncbi:MAG TPA: RDD family protein [Solirubrobacteraceae bacterium]|nr:RDD family protein [Solirubrobacteraceae bacterium]